VQAVKRDSFMIRFIFYRESLTNHSLSRRIHYQRIEKYKSMPPVLKSIFRLLFGSVFPIKRNFLFHIIEIIEK
jgi:hypothetical protein